MNLFEIPIQKSLVIQDDLDKALEGSEVLSLLQDNKVWNCSVDTSYFHESQPDAVKNLEEPLNNCILPFVVNYVKPFLEQPSEIYFDHMWVNRYKPGSYQDRHTHPGSEVSFVYMYKTTEKHSSLRFFNPIEAHIYDVKNRSGVLFSPLEVDFFLQPRELILFPSYLQHCVSPRNTDGERITLSGNITIKPVES